MADTTVTVQTIIDNSIARAKDAHSTQWTDAQLLIFLNKAVDFTHKLLIRLQSEIIITDVTVDMVASTQEYALSGNLDDFWAMAHHGVYFSGEGNFLVPATYEDKIRAVGDTTDAAPESYYVTDTHLGVINIPTTTSVAAYPTLSLRYFKKNTTLTFTDNMPYNNILNESIGSFMDHMAILKTNAQTAEFTALYNTLEESTMTIINKRVPI